MKKKLTFKTRASEYYVFSPTDGFKDPLFTFVAPPKDNVVVPYVALTYCRESFCEYLRQELRKIVKHGINLDKLHMVMHRRVNKSRKAVELKGFETQVLAGQKMANAIEGHYGWPLTKIYPAVASKNPPVQPHNGFYYITASKRWMKAPAMLSLYTLLFRIAVLEKDLKFKHRIRSIKSLYTVLDEITEKSGSSESAYYKAHGDKWKLVLDNYKKLFGCRKMEDLYFPGGNSSYHFSEGINSLCDGNSKDLVLKRAFSKIVKST